MIVIHQGPQTKAVISPGNIQNSAPWEKAA